MNQKNNSSLSPGDKVIVSLNGIKTGEGIVINPKEAGFSIKEGNVAVKIIKTLHSVAKKGIFQFSKSNIKRLSS